MNDTRIRTFKNFVGELTAVYKRTDLPTTTIHSSLSLCDFIYPYFDEIMDDHEEVKVVHLNRKNQVVNVHHVGVGTDSGCLVDIKDIMRQAIIIKTSSIIMVHNHPSGNLQPSTADVALSKKLQKAGELLDIKVLDSIIVTRESYTSLVDEGKI